MIKITDLDRKKTLAEYKLELEVSRLNEKLNEITNSYASAKKIIDENGLTEIKVEKEIHTAKYIKEYADKNKHEIKLTKEPASYHIESAGTVDVYSIKLKRGSGSSTSTYCYTDVEGEFLGNYMKYLKEYYKLYNNI